MKAVGKVRRELGVRTVFNLLGPLLNPAGARRQIIGVFSLALTEKLAEALRQLHCEQALIFSGEDGLDEMSIEGRTQITELRDGTLRTEFVVPEDFGLTRRNRNELQGGDAAQNARILRDVLENRGSEAQRDIVLLNAAAGIYVAGAATVCRGRHDAGPDITFQRAGARQAGAVGEASAITRWQRQRCNTGAVPRLHKPLRTDKVTLGR